MTQPGRPAVFVHGLWLHASSWDPWLEVFQEAGYAPTAPGWPGDSDTVEQARQDPSKVAGKGIDDVVDHYARIIRGLEAPPVIIGHSFGGLIAQRLLGQDLAAAAVAIDAAPIKGVLNLPISALKVASIALRKPANRNLAVSLTAEQFRYGFGNALTEQESAELYDRWTVPSPGKPLFEAALANFTPRSPAKVNTGNKTRGPLLLTAGGQDHTVPPAITTSTRKLYHKPAHPGGWSRGVKMARVRVAAGGAAAAVWLPFVLPCGCRGWDGGRGLPVTPADFGIRTRPQA
jgi:non-heme chloroperoxidase